MFHRSSQVLIPIIATLASTSMATAATETPRPKVVEIVVSPQLNASEAAAAQLATLRIFQDVLKGGDRLVVTDASTLQRVAAIDLSPRIVAADGKYRQWKLELHTADLVRLNGFFQRLKQNAGGGERPTLDLPALSDVLGQRLAQYGTADRQLVFFGSPIYADRHNTGFSFVETYPSDGHLRSADSPFSVLGKERRLAGTTVHVVYPPGDMFNELQAEKLARFYSLWFRAQGSALVTFSPDAAIWERVGSLQLTPIAATADPTDSKVLLYSVRRRAVEMWEAPPTPPSRPPAPSSNGLLKIGIRWAESIDLDLYVGIRGELRELYYGHPHADWGRHDWDNLGGGSEFETIEVNRAVDLSDITARVNFFSGRTASSPRGEVRVDYDGKVYEGDFQIFATSGNFGGVGLSHWAELDIPAIVGLKL